MATKEENIKFKEYLATNNIDPTKATTQDALAFKQTIQPVQTPEQLKTNISTWTTTPWMSKAQQNYQYNLATWNKQGAREVMLWSKDVLTGWDIKTSVSAPEVKKIQDLWVKSEDISKNITVDKWVREEMLPQTEKTIVETPDGKTITTKETPTETKPITAETQWKDTDKSLWTLEQMVEARYGTVATQNPDWTLSAIIWDKKYQWNMDKDWNPIKSEVPLTPAEKIKMQSINKYMTASTDELYSAMISGNITKEMEQSLMTNPNYVIAKEKVSKKLSTDNINSQMNGIYNTMTWKPTKEDTTIEDMSNKTTTNLESKWIDVPKFSEYMAKDETLSADVISLNSQLKTIKELKDTAEANTKRIVKNYPWISKASSILLSARENEPLYEQIKALSYDATELQANINYRQSILEEDYKAELAQYQLQEWRAYQERLTAEERAYNQEMTQEERVYNEQKATADLERQYAYTYWDLDSTNPTLQNIAIKNALTDMYTKYQDIPWMESMARKEQKVQDLMNKWMTWSQAIAQVENEIRSSDRYKQMITPESEKAQALIKMWEDKIYDPNTWKWIVSPWVSTDNLPWLSNIAWNNIQCGKAVNTYIQDVTWSYGKMWDTLNSKLKAIQSIWESEWPVQWWVFVSNPLNNTVWHTWIVQTVNNDWSITVLEANAEWKSTWWPLEEKTYSAEQVARMKFSKAPQKTYSDNDIALLSSVTKLDKQWKETLKENNFTEQEWANFNAWLLPATKKQKADADTIVKKVDDIFAWDWTDAVWTLKSRVFTWAWTDRKVTELKVNALKDLLAMANLDKIKWAMSDKDIEFLRNTATYLSTDLSEPEFEKTLKQIRDKYAWISTGTPTTTTTTPTTWAWTIIYGWKTYTFTK